MILKNLTDNAKNLAANAKIEDMSRLFKNSVAGKQDVKSALSGVMVWLSLLSDLNEPFDWFWRLVHATLKWSYLL